MVAATEPTESLLELFARYNQDLWPAHLVAYALGAVLVALLIFRRSVAFDFTITLILSGLWIWLGIVFQGMYATDIDPILGMAYAVLFVAQGLLLAREALTGGLSYPRTAATLGQKLGWTALAYALVIYPVIGITLGHGWPEAPLFGMAPCPTTIATFGVLLLAQPAPPRILLLVPLIWAILAPPAAVGRGVWEDVGLAVFGIIAAVIILFRRSPRTPATSSNPAAKAVLPAGGRARERP